MGLISTADSPDQFPCSQEKVLVKLLGDPQCFVKRHYYNPFHNLGAEEAGGPPFLTLSHQNAQDKRWLVLRALEKQLPEGNQ